MPQLYALQLERILARGFSADETLALLWHGSKDELATRIDPEPTWERLLTYAGEHWANVEAAVRGGYRFSFLTIGGLMSLLAIKFRKREETDYRFTGERIEGLRLTGSELALLRSMVPTYWAFLPADAADAEARAVEAGEDAVPDAERMVEIAIAMMP
ncbi:hypothetical protein I8J29_23715 [Paenibacillus sp. MWE-103]|uniref:Uncharacterized protein n=1 Tax=Paenibacillus artemisiicola TaxID=1172618 RepID=A0ABS3WFX3_9BACL|nr:hypothetical protein [Paenibacillus artemisiicola]MBO7747215.1 hypothetical protein [Paenibacillus artemisiicola]